MLVEGVRHVQHEARQSAMRASEMAQLGKVLATKPDNLGSVPETNVVEGENWLPKVVL